jgi:hypothetical protein
VRSRTKADEGTALLERVARVAGVRSATLDARLQGLWGGYGELLRVTLEDGRSAVVKHVRPPRDDGTMSHRRKLRSYEVERAFYARYSEQCSQPPSCRVARPYGLLAEDSGWVFVLEDLDASGFSARRAHASDSDVRATLGWLARFHARFLGVRPEGLWKTGTYWHLATRPDELRALESAELRRAATGLDAALGRARYQTLVHGDAKLENVCFGPGDSEVALVDFQYVVGGVGVKDVAYFLIGCLSPRECERRVPRYLDHYFQQLLAALPAGEADGLEREWRDLFPLAWADFQRFYQGWAPSDARGDPYSERLLQEALSRLRSG